MEERFCTMVKDMARAAPIRFRYSLTLEGLACGEIGCTCVTISHRPALTAFHDTVLALDGEGGWSLHPGHRSLQAAAGAGGGEAAAAAEGGGGAPAAAAAEPAPAQQGGGSGRRRKKKARGADAAAVLAGMTGGPGAAPGAAGQAGEPSQQQQEEEELGDGNEGFSELVLARAPPPGAPARHHPQLRAARLALLPAKVSPVARWRAVLAVLLGGDRRQTAGRLGAVAGVVVLRTLLQDRIASLNGKSVDLVLRQDLRGFVRLIGVSVAQSVASAVLAPSLRHVADMLALSWRARLTKAVCAQYLAGNTAYTVAELAGLPDADARLTRDVERLCDDLAALIPTLVKPVVDLAWFSAQLWRLTGRRGAAIAYAYIALGYGCLRAVTPDFGGMRRREYALEGAFRNAHARLRAHAESVAFFGGGAREGGAIGASFATCVAGGGGGGGGGRRGALVHQLRYLASVVTQCFSACGELLALPKRFAEIGGGITRVSELLEVVGKSSRAAAAAAAAPDGPALPGEEGGLAFSRVDVLTPSGKLLARELSFKVLPGRSLLVTGPNASGKTSLLRMMAGLWPLAGGSIHHPPPPARGAAAGTPGPPGAVYYLIYPLSAQQACERYAGADGSGDAAAALLDAKLCALMDVVRLTYLLEREGGLGAAAEWGEVLSLGEQQRLGMARLFFHRPRFGVLDECTNATSVDIEEALYAHAAGLGISLVTITQRTALVRFHQQELRWVVVVWAGGRVGGLVDGEGNWELREIHDHQQQQQQEEQQQQEKQAG
eukprot:scaffold9.g3200.t1